MNKKENIFYPAALIVAGSDSDGGVGIQADLRTFSAFGVFGCSAITAITAQTPFKVERIDPLLPGSVSAQVKSALDTFAIKAVKTGMLFSEEIIEALAPFFKDLDAPLIVDPIMVSTSGARLLTEEAASRIKTKLLPEADWITPNIPKAELLLSRKIGNSEEMASAAAECAKKWKCGRALKGGHIETGNTRKTDIVAYDGPLYRFSSPTLKLKQATAHGTDCTFSSAFAASLADLHWKDVLCSAKAFVYG